MAWKNLTEDIEDMFDRLSNIPSPIPSDGDYYPIPISVGEVDRERQRQYQKHRYHTDPIYKAARKKAAADSRARAKLANKKRKK